MNRKLLLLLFIPVLLFSQDYIQTLKVNNTTPYVTGAKQWQTANTQSTAYTDFLGDPGTGGVSVTIIIWIKDTYSSFIHDATKIKLSGEINLSLTTGDKIQFSWNPTNGIWEEDWRKLK